MIHHYLASAFANIVRTPFTTAANILTLALGLACFIAAYGIATYWTSADGYHGKADRTFIVGQSQTQVSQSDASPLGNRSSGALAPLLIEDFPEIESAARIRTEQAVLGEGSNRQIFEAGFVDADFLRIFDLTFVAGDPRRALDEPGSLVLTQEAAERLFGTADALGRTVAVNNKIAATVTGVIAPVRQPSFMGASGDAEVRFEALGHWHLTPLGAELDARNILLWSHGWTFLTLPPSASVEAFNRRLPSFVERRLDAQWRTQFDLRFEAFPVNEITTRRLDSLLFNQSGFQLTAVSVLLALGALTLLVASINYANLATAQATGRGQEIGMRRVLGASRAEVMMQCWLEAWLLTLAAAAAAIAVLTIARPAFAVSLGVDVLYFLNLGMQPILIIGGLVIVVGFVAGVYPALVLSRISPAAAVRAGRSRASSLFVTRLLVGVQFATASFLLIALTVAQLQRAHLEEIALASVEDPIVLVNELQEVGVDFDVFAERLRADPRIVGVTTSDRPPWAPIATSGMPLTPSPDVAEGEVIGYIRQIGHDFFPVLGIDVLAGRQFDRERETEPRWVFPPDPNVPVPVIVDRLLAESLGFASPQAAVGEIIYLPSSIMATQGVNYDRPLEVIGVVESDVMRLGAATGSGYVYFYAPNSPSNRGVHPLVRIPRGDVAGGMAALNAVWSQLSPNVPLRARFYDEAFEEAYRQFARINQLFIVLASTAFIISTTGLLGIAVHAASRRRHEIAVRKTLGSSMTRIIRLLLTDFSVPVLIGNLLAWPLGYLAAQTYLSAFAHRIDLTLAPFALSLAITLLIAWAAIIGVVLKAASVRPAEVLRHA